jgi:hypothetical protein
MRKSVNGTFTIGLSETDAVQLNEVYTLSGLTITGSCITGSLISFLVSNDGSNFYPLVNSSSTELTLTVSASARSFATDWNSFLSWNFVKARLGTSASAVNQKTYNQPIIFECKSIE